MTKERYTKRGRKPRRPPLGTGLGQGHGGKRKLPAIVEFGLSIQLQAAQRMGQVEADLRIFRMGQCSIWLGSSPAGWHLSISHPDRYPTWDEIAHARYELAPPDISMAMLLPPRGEYINVHANCFQLWEVRDRRAGGRPMELAPDMSHLRGTLTPVEEPS